MNTLNSISTHEKETFVDTPAVQSSQLPTQIRTILDRMVVPELCPLFQKVRANIKKNEAAGQTLSDSELNARVEKTLALSIPGGALPCPLLTYPRAGATDLEWLDFLQKVPSDFGARVVFMALYARNTLVKTQITLDGNLKQMKQADIDSQVTKALESFAPLCPPDVADTRRAERANRATQGCALPEELTPQQIQDAVTDLLKKLVATKDSMLKAKGVDPAIDVRPLIEQANKAADALEIRKTQAESGTLFMSS